ncbi:MAG: hypothetical protein Q4C95_07980 [Planctomycetia bacterium]|nr:hypothetical protein [Planctomycetia bacterium]
MKKAMFILLFLFFLFIPFSQLFAFTSNKATQEPFSFLIEKIPALTAEGQIYDIPIIIDNRSNQQATFKLTFHSLETIRLHNGETIIESPDSFERTVVVTANGKNESALGVSVLGAYRQAHYPIYCQIEYEWNGQIEKIELRPVIETNLITFIDSEKSLLTLSFNNNDFLKLSETSNYLPYWRYDNGTMNSLPVSWAGSEEQSKGSFNRCKFTRNGIMRSAWSIHPPYAGGAGVNGIRIPVEIPKEQTVVLRFYNAMRDVFDPEPPTDGVTYRVFVQEIDTKNQDSFLEILKQMPDAKNLISERHINNTNWEFTEVDLSSFKGKTILLTFENDPGPNRNTTCDGGFWGDVVLLTNPQPSQILTLAEKKIQYSVNLDLFSNQKPFAPDPAAVRRWSQNKKELERLFLDSTHCYQLANDQFVAITEGKNGFADCVITIGTKDQFLQIDGLLIRFNGTRIGREPLLGSCKWSGLIAVDNKSAAEKLIADQRKEWQKNPYRPATLSCVCYPEKEAIRFQFLSNRPEFIERVEFGTMSEKASRIYYGHGYCLVNPKKFEEPGDGFSCSTSHVGFDFENGLSILEASTLPIDSLKVDPELNIYSISSHPETCLTLLASPKGAMECAKLYRPLFDKEAAPLVHKKAGRFVFDFWGGSYQGVLDRMKEFVRYGLTDSLLIQHVWQHFGYDIRLPDIWPPRSEQGTLAELQETQIFCDENNIPFGLHDNYIDFYPDADGFSYDHILFNPDGSPQKAWYNPGPDIQSYRWNSTHFKPWLERNLNLIKPNLMQTAYFVDVFSSIHIADYYERDGNFVTKDVSLRCWNDCFDTIRETFNNNAITISESGSDVLIGHLDGADAILRRITTKPENFVNVMECDDFEYVPWFDMVNHDRFILHGVGYSDRYQGGMSRSLRGIESDDYISSEILTGHALMGDLPMNVRGMVRKYWLAQTVARAVAMDQIEDFEFVDNNIHRQRIHWKNGTTIFVNRGQEQWEVQDSNGKKHLLPKFGFLAYNDSKELENRFIAAIEMIDGQIAEFCRTNDSYFVNARQKVAGQVVPIRPVLTNFRADGKKFQCSIDWNAFEPTDQPYSIFIHLERPKLWWADKTKLYPIGGGEPVVPTNQWKGTMSSQVNDQFEIPDDIPDGVYSILVGLFDQKSGKRLPLLGTSTENLRIRIGDLEIRHQGDSVSLTMTPVVNDDLIDLRLVPNKKAIAFDDCLTQGAFRLERKTTLSNHSIQTNESAISDSSKVSDGENQTVWTLTPLPEEPVFRVQLDSKFFGKELIDSQEIILSRFNQKDELVDEVLLMLKNDKLEFEVDAAQFRFYEISVRK